MPTILDMRRLTLLLLAALLGPASASALEPAQPKTRVRGLDLAAETRIEGREQLKPGTHQGIRLAYDEVASEYLLAAEGAQQASRVIDPNKLHHIFGKAGHNLGPLVQKFGTQEGTFTAVESATQALVKSQGLTGVFETTVNVAGQNVVVRGTVMEGVARIGTFFIP